MKSLNTLPKVTTGSVAEWSKALVLGTSQKWCGFESHLCQAFFKFFRAHSFVGILLRSLKLNIYQVSKLSMNTSRSIIKNQPTRIPTSY